MQGQHRTSSLEVSWPCQSGPRCCLSFMDMKLPGLLGCKKHVNSRINYQPQLVQDFWTINDICVKKLGTKFIIFLPQIMVQWQMGFSPRWSSPYQLVGPTCFDFSPRKLGKIPILPNTFQKHFIIRQALKFYWDTPWVAEWPWKPYSSTTGGRCWNVAAVFSGGRALKGPGGCWKGNQNGG